MSTCRMALKTTNGRWRGPRERQGLAQSRKLRRASLRRTLTAASSAQDQSASWEKVAESLDSKSPLEIMDHALSTFEGDVAIAFSGAEDVALIEYAHLTGKQYRVFSLDTGRLNPETYRLFDAVEKHYGIRIEYTFPEAEEVVDLVRSKGMFSFYEDGHQECCRVRKVRPLRKQLKGLKAWITGQRKDQSPGTRQGVPVVEVDPVFEGLEGGAGSLIKYNPLSNMSSAEVWNFLRVMGVPTNELHTCGYVSIGCEPCTRPVLPNQAEREGRWWWEDSSSKECGLHSGNIVQGAVDQASEEEKVEDLFKSNAVEPLNKDALQRVLDGPRDVDMLVVLYAPWCRFCKAMEEDYEDLAARVADRKGIRVAKFQADIERDFAESRFGLKTFPHIAMLPASGSAGESIKFGSERRDPDTLEMWINALSSST
ncbi:hypothetical protein M9435_000687 [Picochlorum sp. BPE23]|nr:hypothetical protein M9435_000687 [Picochlorum sp. BPE23]